MRKQFLCGLIVLVTTLALGCPSLSAQTTLVAANNDIEVVVFKIGEVNYYLQDNASTISKTEMDIRPYIKSGRTYVPVRFLANALGIPDDNISWDQSAKAVTLNGHQTISMVIDNKDMQSGDKTIAMDAAPELIDGRTMLPARYVAEGLGFKVDWDASRQLVICYPRENPSPDLTQIIEEIEGKEPVEKPDPVEEPKPEPESVEARYLEAKKNGGFFKEEQLDAEMADYLWNEVIDYDMEERAQVSDEKWAIIRPLLMDTGKCQDQFPKCPYKITSITPSKYLVSSDFRESWCCYCLINGNQLAYATVYLNFQGYDIRWGTFLSENIFEGMGTPAWRLLR